jgi:HEAT repeat protein
MDPRERDSIRADLGSADDEVRRLAVQRIVVLPEAEAIGHLEGCLGDASWRVRKAVVERLVACRDSARVCDLLVEALADADNPGRRNAAVEGLVRCGRPAVERLVRASASPDVDVRKLAVDALAGIQDARGTERLLSMLSDPDPNVRGAVADALGSSADLVAAGPLLDRAGQADEDPLVRLSALRALTELEAEVPVHALEGALADPLLQPAGYALLAHADPDAASGTLEKGLTASARSAREAAMRSLLRLVGGAAEPLASSLVTRIRTTLAPLPEYVEDLTRRLADADLPARLWMVQFLGLLDQERVVLPILESGRDEALREVVLGVLEALDSGVEAVLLEAWPRLDGELRALACRAVAPRTRDRALALLLQGLDDGESEVRVAAARAIAVQPDPSWLPRLIARLASASQQSGWDGEEELAAVGEALVAIASARDLTPDGPADLISRLSARLPLANAGERVQITRVLGRLAEPEASEAARLLLCDPAPEVRRSAVEALSRFDVGAEALRPALVDDSPAVRVAAASVLEASDPAVFEDLSRLARDEDARVRAAAIRSVAAGMDAVPAEERTRRGALLSSALQDEGVVALAALEGLERVGDADAARMAATALSREAPEILQIAIRCLAAHADRDTLEELLPLVGHSEWSVRAEAIQALAERFVARAVPGILGRLETEQDDFVRDVILRALKRLEGEAS